MLISKQYLKRIIQEEIIKESLLGQIKNLFATKKHEEIFPKPLLDKYYSAIKAGMSKEEAISKYLNPLVDQFAKEIKDSIAQRETLAGKEQHALKKEVPAKIWEGK